LIEYKEVKDLVFLYPLQTRVRYSIPAEPYFDTRVLLGSKERDKINFLKISYLQQNLLLTLRV